MNTKIGLIKWFGIILTFIVGLMLTILPLPIWAEWFRPEWMVLILIYWILALPYNIGVGFAWIMGLLLDVLSGTVLGEHSLVLVFIAYFVAKFHIRIRLFSIWQQSLLIFVSIVIYQALIVWIEGLLGHPAESFLYWIPSLTSAVLWPWILFLLRDYSYRFKILQKT